MSPDLTLSTAQFASKPALPALSKDVTKIDKAAKEFEAVFVNEFLSSMFEGIKTDGMFGGGPGEGIFRSMMLDQYSKTIANNGGFGLAAAVKREMLHMQEAAR
jgi:Rod binding domain-containing protein